MPPNNPRPPPIPLPDPPHEPITITIRRVIHLIYHLIVLKLLHAAALVVRVIRGPQAATRRPLRHAIARREQFIINIFLSSIVRLELCREVPVADVLSLRDEPAFVLSSSGGSGSGSGSDAGFRTAARAKERAGASGLGIQGFTSSSSARSSGSSGQGTAVPHMPRSGARSVCGNERSSRASDSAVLTRGDPGPSNNTQRAYPSSRHDVMAWPSQYSRSSPERQHLSVVSQPWSSEMALPLANELRAPPGSRRMARSAETLPGSTPTNDVEFNSAGIVPRGLRVRSVASARPLSDV